jgi:restriction system protein
MALWLVRAGRKGEQEDAALKNSVIAIGWNDMPDLSPVKSKDELKALYEKVYPGTKKMAVANMTGQLWSFVHNVKVGDLVVVPLKLSPAMAIGRVRGSYQYRRDLGDIVHHTRPIEWITTDLPRTVFDQDLLYSFGAFMTVCQVQRNNAEQRVLEILKHPGAPPVPRSPGEAHPDVDHVEVDVEEADVEEMAQDQIRKFIDRKFKGHDLTRIVEAVLKARGYTTQRATPGPDGGVDVLAGAGYMGFDNPRLCVQVKSGSSPIDVGVLRALQGSMKSFGAEQCLFVSWSGYTRPAIEESRRSFFNVRLWDSDDLLQAVFENYNDLPADLKAELPLKKIWSLVPEDESE